MPLIPLPPIPLWDFHIKRSRIFFGKALGTKHFILQDSSSEAVGFIMQGSGSSSGAYFNILPGSILVSKNWFPEPLKLMPRNLKMSQLIKHFNFYVSFDQIFYSKNCNFVSEIGIFLNYQVSSGAKLHHFEMWGSGFGTRLLRLEFLGFDSGVRFQKEPASGGSRLRASKPLRCLGINEISRNLPDIRCLAI